MEGTFGNHLKRGDRVMVVTTHRWMPGRQGTIKDVEERIGNRFLVKFDRDELGLWHDEDGDPLLRLGRDDLTSTDESLSFPSL